MNKKIMEMMDSIEAKWKREAAELTKPTCGHLVYSMTPGQVEGVVDIWEPNGLGSHGEVIRNEEWDRAVADSISDSLSRSFSS